MTRAPMPAGATCLVAIVMVLSALLSAPSRLGAQVLRNPETPYHFLRYDDVPSDQNSPYWPEDFWSPLKFIPLDIAPGSYINFGGEDRERVEHFSNPFFGLTPRRNTTYDLHRLLFEGDLHIGDTFRTFIQFGNHLATAPSTSPPLMSIVWTCSRGLPTCGLRSGRTGASLSGEGVRRCSSGRPGWSTFAKGRTSV